VPDPPFLIVRRNGASQRVRDTLYGGRVFIKGMRARQGKPGEPDRSQRALWAFLFKDFVRPGGLTYEEVYALAEEYVALYGVATTLTVAADEILRCTFWRFLNERGHAMGRGKGREKTVPGYIGPGVGLKTFEYAQKAHDDATRRAWKAKA